MPKQNKKGREVLQHQATPEAATPNAEQSADYSHLNHEDNISDTLRAKCQRIIRRMDECPQAFAAFVAHISERIAANPMWTCGSDELRRFIGGKEFTDSKGRTFSVRHGHDAVFMRELCRRHPNIAPHIRLHRSRYDAIYSNEV